jgi:hypothetical protein
MTTFLCVNKGGGFELNPLTNTSSFWSIFQPELVFAAVVFLSCAISERMLRNSILPTRSENFAQFSNRVLKSWGGIWWGVLMLCFALGVIRILPILSNTSILVFGKSPLIDIARWLSSSFNWTLRKMMIFINLIFFSLLTFPLSYFLFVMIRTGQRSGLVNDRDGHN